MVVYLYIWFKQNNEKYNNISKNEAAIEILFDFKEKIYIFFYIIKYSVKY
jgi:hypothetical protein